MRQYYYFAVMMPIE